MKKVLKLFVASALLMTGFASCDDDDDDDAPQVQTVTIDSSMPQGAFTPTVSGTFVDDNAPTSGQVQIGTDEAGTQFLRLGSDFTTNVATGTVAIYLSTSDTFTADPPNGNPDLQLVGNITTNGEHFFILDPLYSDSFTHVIAWCTSVSVQFGNAQIN